MKIDDTRLLAVLRIGHDGVRRHPRQLWAGWSDPSHQPRSDAERALDRILGGQEDESGLVPHSRWESGRWKGWVTVCCSTPYRRPSPTTSCESWSSGPRCPGPADATTPLTEHASGVSEGAPD